MLQSKEYNEGYDWGSSCNVYHNIPDRYVDDDIKRKDYLRGVDNAVEDRLS